MNKMIFALALVSGFAAHAAQVPAFKCQVPSATPSVTATLSVSDSEAMDYVTLDLNDKGAATLFIQMEKGSFQKQVDAGGFTSLILDEKFAQGPDGVIRNAGLMALGLDQGKWGGILSARGNVYPLECTKL
jgi:hypothetical protein